MGEFEERKVREVQFGCRIFRIYEIGADIGDEW